MEENRPVITGLKRISKPGLRVYVQKKEIPRVYGGMGVAIISTSTGLRTGQQAWRQSTGGELLCYIW
jgi:small subunit ribosomal protein S8